jgi:hypothetical protein
MRLQGSNLALGLNASQPPNQNCADDNDIFVHEVCGDFTTDHSECSEMSAFGGKADIPIALSNVRFRDKADITRGRSAEKMVPLPLMAVQFQLPLLASRKAIILARSSAEVRPPYGFILLPGTTWSGLAMKRSSVALSHVKSASFMELE